MNKDSFVNILIVGGIILLALFALNSLFDEPKKMGGSVGSYYNNGLTNSSTSVTTTYATRIIAPTPATTTRDALRVCNSTSTTVYLMELASSTATTGTQAEFWQTGFRLDGGECFEWNPVNLYQGAVYAIASGTEEVTVSTQVKQ